MSSHPFPVGTRVLLPEDWSDQLGVQADGTVQNLEREPGSPSGFAYRVNGYWWEGSELIPLPPPPRQCAQCLPGAKKVAVVYAMGPNSGDWADYYCEEHQDTLGPSAIKERLKTC